MDLGTITGFINSCGFPIAATCAMGFLLCREQNLHKEEVNTLKEVITDLKVAIIQLTEKLGGDSDAKRL